MKATKEKKGGIVTKESFLNISNLIVLENLKNKKKKQKIKNDSKIKRNYKEI